ncbi:MAG: DUF4136 domain-containing protein [Pontiella sp.]
MNRYFFLCVVSISILSGCSSTSVTRDYNETTDFSTLKTFAWQHADQPQTGNPRIDNDLIDERVRAAVNRDLSAKGFNLVEEPEADFLVAYFVEYKQRIGGGTMSVGMRGGSYGRAAGVGYNTGISDYEEGYLTIDVIDPEEGKNFWRGVGRRTSYENNNPKKITKIVNQSVSSILKKFPPKK